MIKCNVDATFFNNNTIIGYEMCFRDSTSQFLLEKSDYSPSSFIILKAGTLGLLEALKVIISNGMHIVLFEIDFKILSNAYS